MVVGHVIRTLYFCKKLEYLSWLLVISEIVYDKLRL